MRVRAGISVLSQLAFGRKDECKSEKSKSKSKGRLDDAHAGAKTLKEKPQLKRYTF